MDALHNSSRLGSPGSNRPLLHDALLSCLGNVFSTGRRATPTNRIVRGQQAGLFPMKERRRSLRLSVARRPEDHNNAWIGYAPGCTVGGRWAVAVISVVGISIHLSALLGISLTDVLICRLLHVGPPKAPRIIRSAIGKNLFASRERSPAISRGHHGPERFSRSHSVTVQRPSPSPERMPPDRQRRIFGQCIRIQIQHHERRTTKPFCHISRLRQF